MTRPPRTSTPPQTLHDGKTRFTMKRCCNGCSTVLGDVDPIETAAAMLGLPLPDVRDECPGCAPTLPARPARCCACYRLAFRDTSLCGTCWKRLPTSTRDQVMGTYSEGSIAAHAIALDAARLWLIARPLGVVKVTDAVDVAATSASGGAG